MSGGAPELRDAIQRAQEAMLLLEDDPDRRFLAWLRALDIEPEAFTRAGVAAVNFAIANSSPAPRALLLAGLHRHGDDLAGVLIAIYAQAFQCGWIAATLHADETASA